jgi:hypothetical protein
VASLTPSALCHKNIYLLNACCLNQNSQNLQDFQNNKTSEPGFTGLKDFQEFKFTENMLSQHCETPKWFRNMLSQHCETPKWFRNMLSQHCETSKWLRNMLSQHCETLKWLRNILSQHCEANFQDISCKSFNTHTLGYFAGEQPKAGYPENPGSDNNGVKCYENQQNSPQ